MPLPIAVVFEVPGFAGLVRRTDADRKRSIQDAIALAGDSIAAELAERGFVERARSRSMPVIFGVLPAGALDAIAHYPSLKGITLDEAPEGLGEYAANDPVDEHEIDVT